jgi:hypothetical protein
MAYDEALATRLRALLQDGAGTGEKRMFGGLAFLVHGHLAVAVSGQGGLMVRVDPAAGPGLVDDLHVHRVVMPGRAMDGWLRVDAEALEDDDALRQWLERGTAYARSLPPK